MSKANLPPAKNTRGIPLAYGMRLRNGQIFGAAPTIAIASTKSKRAVARDDCGRAIAPLGENVALSGAPKNSGAAPVKPGMRNRSGE
jgi:hypothetical protein